MKKNQGFSIVEVLVVAVVLVVLGVLGYVAYNRFYSNNDNTGAALVDEVPSAPKVTTKTDLKTVSSTIDSVDLDAVDAQISELDKELNKF